MVEKIKREGGGGRGRMSVIIYILVKIWEAVTALLKYLELTHHCQLKLAIKKMFAKSKNSQ